MKRLLPKLRLPPPLITLATCSPCDHRPATKPEQGAKILDLTPELILYGRMGKIRCSVCRRWGRRVTSQPIPLIQCIYVSIHDPCSQCEAWGFQCGKQDKVGSQVINRKMHDERSVLWFVLQIPSAPNDSGNITPAERVHINNFYKLWSKFSLARCSAVFFRRPSSYIGTPLYYPGAISHSSVVYRRAISVIMSHLSAV